VKFFHTEPTMLLFQVNYYIGLAIFSYLKKQIGSTYSNPLN